MYNYCKNPFDNFTKDQGLQTKPAEKKKEEIIQPFAELYYRMKK